MHDRVRLAADLRALGLAAGDTVMVHASVRAVGEIAGGPDEIHLAIKDVITQTGTLMMYASCPRYVDEVGRGNLSPAQEAELLEKLPAFNPETARSARDNGALVELLRTWPGSRVNHHVVRFVTWGRHAEDLFASSRGTTRSGADRRSSVSSISTGSSSCSAADHDTVTFLHYAEHVADLPGKRVSRYQVPVLENGARVWRVDGGGRHERGRRAPDTGPTASSRASSTRICARRRTRAAAWATRARHLIRARDLFDFSRRSWSSSRGCDGGGGRAARLEQQSHRHRHVLHAATRHGHVVIPHFGEAVDQQRAEADAEPRRCSPRASRSRSCAGPEQLV